MKQAHAKFGALPLIALRAFEAAARRRSFRDGAAEVGLTPSAVSHHVRGLEASLGTALFLRLHRRVEPTAAGAALAAALTQGLGTIAAAVEAARAPQGHLTVSAAPIFAGQWLLPAAAALAREGIEVRVEATAAHSDVAGGACDVAIRLAPRPPPNLTAVRLATSPVVLLAAPARLAGRASLAPEEIAAAPLLGLAIRPGFWSDLLGALGAQPCRAPAAMFDDVNMALAAAAAGHGLAFAPEILVKERLDAGVLALAHPRRFGARSAWSYWFVTRPEISDRRDVRRLRDWLRAALPATDTGADRRKARSLAGVNLL